jgi:signal transduction histidine kinase
VTRPLRLLLVGDSEDDAKLIVGELRQNRSEPIVSRVWDADALKRALSERDWDIIIADHTLRAFGGVEALTILQQSGRDVPVVIVTGTAEALQATEATSRFVTMLSHEVRNPLNSILGFTEMLLDGNQDPPTERQRRYLSHVRSAGRQMLAIVNDLLDLARVKAGDLQVDLDGLNLRDLAAAVAEQVRPLAADAGLTLKAPDTGDPAVCLADMRLTNQVLLNLFSNGIKSTPEGGRVEVSVSAEPDWAELTVADTGPCIPPTSLNLIFEEFTQLRGEVSRRGQKGTGLSLSLTKRLVELMGGTITVASEVGKGTAFTVRLPAPHPDGSDRV